MPPIIKVRSSPRTTGRGAMTRIRTDFRSGSTRTLCAVAAGSAAPVRGERALHPAVRSAGLVDCDDRLRLAAHNILAGDDLNGDGDGGTFPPDRARTNLGDPRVERRPQCREDADAGNGGRAGGAPVHAGKGTWTACSKCSTCSPDQLYGDQQHFGPGAFPGAGLPTFGQFTQAGPPLRVQLAARVSFRRRRQARVARGPPPYRTSSAFFRASSSQFGRARWEEGLGGVGVSICFSCW